MDFFDALQIGLTFVVLVLIAPTLGRAIYRILEHEAPVGRWGQRIENLFYRVAGVDAHSSMTAKGYAQALLIFNALGFLGVFGLQLFQSVLPLNPQGLPDVSWHLAFNTAVSFVTNTNWQSYSGEATLSHLTQMLGLGVQNFLSAATGLGVMAALLRGLTRAETTGLGNFWQDITRGTIYLLLPLSFVMAVFLVGEGVVQNFSAPVQTLGVDSVSQVLPQGPAASQVSIKQLGTNGGGFFGVNSAHPFENPTPLSNWIQLLAILLIPVALVFTFGHYAKSRRQAFAVFAAMGILLTSGLLISLIAEYHFVPVSGNGVSMEGKEIRFGVTGTVLWSVFTTAASNGSVNGMISSLSPISGLVSLFNMMLGEVIFGGVGAGLYGMFLFVILTVFLSGLMVGRTPEYLGKKIEAPEIRMVIIGLLIPNAAILIGAGLSVILPTALSSLANQGPHGLTEILYAFTSAAANNGSAFAGLNANTPYFNVMLGITILLGRFGVILPILAIAGSMAKKRVTPPGPGTFATDSSLFVMLLVSVILIVGGLTFLPALSLGPIVEHLLMLNGRSF